MVINRLTLSPFKYQYSDNKYTILILKNCIVLRIYYLCEDLNGYKILNKIKYVRSRFNTSERNACYGG